MFLTNLVRSKQEKYRVSASLRLPACCGRRTKRSDNNEVSRNTQRCIASLHPEATGRGLNSSANIHSFLASLPHPPPPPHSLLATCSKTLPPQHYHGPRDISPSHSMLHTRHPRPPCDLSPAPHLHPRRIQPARRALPDIATRSQRQQHTSPSPSLPTHHQQHHALRPARPRQRHPEPISRRHTQHARARVLRAPAWSSAATY